MRESITISEMEDTYVWPDLTRPSTHDEQREIRTRYFGPDAIEVVVDTVDGRIVTVWRKAIAR